MDPRPTYAPNPMAIDLSEASVGESAHAAPAAESNTVAPPSEAIDHFDAERHTDLLDRLEHELGLVDAALSHIDDNNLDAAEEAIKELSRHQDDGQVALPLR